MGNNDPKNILILYRAHSHPLQLHFIIFHPDLDAAIADIQHFTILLLTT